MDKYWKIGEIAEITGLSIRTLRYYDQINLLSPSLYTEAGHRRYSLKALQTLMEILSLKQMGFSLEEVKQLQEQQAPSTVRETLAMHTERIKADMEAQQQLLTQLEEVQQEFSSSPDNMISLQSLTMLFDAMRADRSKYFNQAQLDWMRDHFHTMDKTTLQHSQLAFYKLLTRLRDKKEKHYPPSDPSVIEIATKWKSMMNSFLPENNELQQQAEKFYADNPDLAAKTGLEADLYAYLHQALSFTKADNER
ncbi:MerR family transcriptional regulator [Gracilibacillus phocaeensis]|uniref:MerR family transcriptional regulator n=1 Tax=Gracilibacillus phocaeensis TaxID=2042304 RepID=UPI001031B9C0|nr:MerR family transcriptional regulator [Gracilibacillus phocaeensis]